MASRLLNLRKTLTWRDFGRPRPGQAPRSGQRAAAAQTRTTYTYTVNGERVPGTSQVRLKDDVLVKIQLDGANTWVMQWALQQDRAFKENLLHHEQGHYDLVALFVRDLFIDLMQLKENTYGGGPALMADVQAVMNRYARPIREVHARYDRVSDHGLQAGGQRTWDGYIQQAFTKERTPRVTAPDGKAYKVPLLEVLRQNGVTF